LRELLELKNKRRLINHEIKVRKNYIECKRLDEFKQKYKTTLSVLDIAMVLVIIFNIGALLITNSLVLKENPETELYEANVIVAEENNYVPHPEAVEQFKAFTNQIDIYWLIMILYLFIRFTIKNEIHLYFLILLVTYLLVSTGYDFFHDFGYWIGKVL